jgi:hypothetical protein
VATLTALIDEHSTANKPHNNNGFLGRRNAMHRFFAMIWDAGTIQSWIAFWKMAIAPANKAPGDSGRRAGRRHRQKKV